MVEYIQARADGWLRIVPDLSGGAHWKWRWHHGPWAGYYEYYRQNPYETAYTAWEGLQRKLRAVDAGEMRPHRDNYYKS